MVTRLHDGACSVPGFRAWLDRQAYRPDPIGDLARDARADTEFPADGGLDVFAARLEALGASTAAAEAMSAAWTEHAAIVARHAVLHVTGRGPTSANPPVYRDPELRRLYDTAVARGEYEPCSGCGHIAGVHRRGVCVPCRIAHATCPNCAPAGSGGEA